MGSWKYEGFTRDGKKESGAIQATNEREARKLLRIKGVRPKKLTPPSWLEFDITEYLVEKGVLAQFGTKEIIVFTKQLSIMIDAGVPVVQALEILFRQQQNPSLKLVIKRVAHDVKEGKSISESMADNKGFSNLYVSLIKVGEVGGVLDKILNKLCSHMENQEKVKAKVKSAMTYPVIVVAIGTIIVWGMMVFVVPQFVGMLKDTGQETPFITQLVVDTSEFIGSYSIHMIVGLVVALAFFKAWIKEPSGKFIFDRIMMKLPLLGGIVIKGNLTSFARTLATMMGAGVSLIDSLDVCMEIVDNGVIVQDLEKVKKKIIQGKTLTDPLSKIEYFPAMVVEMVSVGEQTGKLDEMLEKCSSVFEDEINGLVDNMSKMIEPLIIVVLGSIIAIVLIAMYLPIFMSAGGGGV